MSQFSRHVCHLCEAVCGILVEHEGDTILSIRGDKEDPLSRGHICPKAMALKDVHEDPDRLRTPQRRIGDRWQSVPWEEALDEVALRIGEIQDRYGRDSVAIYQGNPMVHNYGAALYGQIFQQILRSRNRFSATSVDQLPHMLAALEMFGHQLSMPIPDIDRTQFFLIFGANPLVSNGSIMTAPDVKRRMEAIRSRGGRIIVFDPRYTETAAIADQHHFIRPGTDTFVLAALLQVLFSENLCRPGRLAAFTDGLSELAVAIAPFTPEAVAQTTGVDATTIRSLARDIAAAPSASIYGRVGISTQPFGGLAAWLLYALTIVTGNLDRPGGTLFTHPAFDLINFASKIGLRGHFAKRYTRVRHLPEFSGEFPVSTLAEEIETTGSGQIHGLITMAGNPVLSAPNGRRLERALPGLEFMVALDIYRNETTRHAHLILPPTFGLENDQYDVIFHALAVRNTARYSLPVLQAPADTLRDWQILLALSTRLLARKNRVASIAAHALHRTMTTLGPAAIVDLGLRLGPYGRSMSMSLSKLKASPQGIDLGPLRPSLPGRLATKNHRICLVPSIFLNDLDRLKKSLVSYNKTETFSLIGRRELRSNNSWMHNSERLIKGPERCTLRIHPDDAAKLHLQDGARVLVTSRSGAITATLELTKEMMPGVVSLPHGWGHHREGIGLQIAASRPGVSINDITDEQAVDPLSGAAAFSGVQVHIAPA